MLGKTRKFTLAALALVLMAALLTGCDESQYEPTFTPPSTPAPPLPLPVSAAEEPTPTPEPDIELPDEWPTAYLPENFPVMPHTAIWNVRRENGEIKMRVAEDHDYIPDEPFLLNIPLSTYGLYYLTLMDTGYLSHRQAFSGPGQPQRSRYFNQEGTVCELLEAGRSHNGEMVWDITVKYHQALTFDESVSFLWLPLDTDLGLEELVFDEWPVEYLPEGFPQPIAMTPVSMVQRKNGVFITFMGETGDYERQLENAGYQKKGTVGHGGIPGYHTSPFYNSKKDRYYYIFDQAEIDAIHAALAGMTTGENQENNAAGRKTVIQVIKGEDTERYWQSQGEQ